MAEILFVVSMDEDGNYCAVADTPRGQLCTDAKDLNGLYRMILDVLSLYQEDTGTAVSSFALRFATPRGVAA